MRAKAKNAAKGATLIATNTVVHGDIHFVDQLYVNGTVEGCITADGESKATLIVSEEGRVKGDIRVPYVVVNGHVDGDVHATTQVELATKAQVKGDVYYKLIEMQLGAKVDGQLLHADDDSIDPKVHKLEIPSSDTNDAGLL